jgi:hypothetical protein
VTCEQVLKDKKFSVKEYVNLAVDNIDQGCDLLIIDINSKLNPASEVIKVENKIPVYSVENYKESFNKLSEAEQKNFIKYIELQDKISVLKENLRKQEEILGDNSEKDINRYSQLKTANNLKNEINSTLKTSGSIKDSLYNEFNDAQKDLVKCYYLIQKDNPNALVEYLNQGLDQRQRERDRILWIVGL